MLDDMDGCYNQRNDRRKEIQDLLSRNAAVSTNGQQLLETLLDNLITSFEADCEKLRRRNAHLEDRLLQIENSLLFRMMRLPGRLFLDWKGRLGQLLLRSPFHPLYLGIISGLPSTDQYRLWVERERPLRERALSRQPLISIVLPVHNPRREWLEAAVGSISDQTYGSWQLCVCDDASSEAWVAEYLAAKAATDRRICFTRSSEHLGISGALNEAGTLAKGEYVGFLDQDDVLSPQAIYAVADAVEQHPPDLLYTDEDYITAEGDRVQPVFKPAFSPDLLRCCMYMGHFLVVRRDTLEEIGWFRTAYDGSQDYDLALRVVERNSTVQHIPRVLYHWRRHPGSTASNAAAKPYTHDAGLRALSDAVGRRNPDATVVGATPNTYRVRWPIHEDVRVSIIVCSRNAKLLGRCLNAIERRTAHTNREIVVVQHHTGYTADMNALLARQRCKHIPYTGAFNFSAMSNLGAAHAEAPVLLFLNDDTAPIAPEWLHEMLKHALRPEVGVVGAKLLYPSGAIQHAGIVADALHGTEHLHRDAFAAQYWNWLPFTRNVSAVTGACMAIRKSVFTELGGFDEAFPVNFNDVDLCLRARRAGYEVILEPAAVLRHDECRSRQRGVRFQESELFERRWATQLPAVDPYFTPWLYCRADNGGLALEDLPDPAPR